MPPENKEEIAKELITYFEKYPKVSLVLGINNKKEFIEADNVFQALIKAREFAIKEVFETIESDIENTNEGSFIYSTQWKRIKQKLSRRDGG